MHFSFQSLRKSQFLLGDGPNLPSPKSAHELKDPLLVIDSTDPGKSCTQTYGLTAEVAAEGKGETISDGIALTGFSAASQFVPYFLYGGQFVSAPTLPAGAGASYANGYLAAGSNSSVQTNFFAPGMFDPDVLAAATETGQPVTVGELLTLAAPASAPNGYSGPVIVVTGGG